MAWYIVHTGINAKDMFGERAYVELEDGNIEEDDVMYHKLKNKYPEIQGQYMKKFSRKDWEIDSESFESKEDFMAEFGEIVGTASNGAYTKKFGLVSTKEARSKAR